MRERMVSDYDKNGEYCLQYLNIRRVFSAVLQEERRLTQGDPWGYMKRSHDKNTSRCKG